MLAYIYHCRKSRAIGEPLNNVQGDAPSYRLDGRHFLAGCGSLQVEGAVPIKTKTTNYSQCKASGSFRCDRLTPSPCLPSRRFGRRVLGSKLGSQAKVECCFWGLGNQDSLGKEAPHKAATNDCPSPESRLLGSSWPTLYFKAA